MKRLTRGVNSPVSLADHEDPGENSGTVLQLLALVRLWVKVVLQGLRSIVIEGSAVVALIVCFHGKDPQVLAHHIQARYGPYFEATALVASEEGVQQLSPARVHLRPHQLRRL